jgi:malonyl-CoA decarboxylase
MAPGGTGIIVGMRADLLGLLREHPELKPVDDDLLYVLRSWFNRGFLTLATISWETPAHILEKLIAYEAVHEMQGWDDLRRRLAEDRRCFAFFHPALPDEPLIFVQVALVEGLSGNIQDLLAESGDQQPQKFDTAIFYSISNCQAGLKGISFGNFLIKQVVLELRREFDSLKHFATLSPIPGFRRWLNKELTQPELITLNEVQRTLLESMGSADWYEKPDHVAALQPVLMQLCSLYLAHAKRGDEPLDPVERFHLGNGAQIARLNWAGDISDRGLSQSAGMLVNYGYELRKVEANHEAFVNDHRIVMAAEFRKLCHDSEVLLQSSPG